MKTRPVPSPFPTARPLKLRPSLYLPTPKAKPTRSETAALVGTQLRRYSLLFDATALHGIEDLGTQSVSYLSIVFTLRS